LQAPQHAVGIYPRHTERIAELCLRDRQHVVMVHGLARESQTLIHLAKKVGYARIGTAPTDRGNALA